MECREAESGEKALALLAASRPDLVITDLKMDGMDGLTLFDEIRKQATDAPRHHPDRSRHHTRCRRAPRAAGFLPFSPSPSTAKHLLDQVEQALQFSGVGSGRRR